MTDASELRKDYERSIAGLRSQLADRDAKLAAVERLADEYESMGRLTDALFIRARLSLSVPTSPQTKSNARLFLNGKPVDEVLRPGRPITEPPRPANQIVITRDDLLPSPTEDERVAQLLADECEAAENGKDWDTPMVRATSPEQGGRRRRCIHGECEPHLTEWDDGDIDVGEQCPGPVSLEQQETQQ